MFLYIMWSSFVVTMFAFNKQNTLATLKVYTIEICDLKQHPLVRVDNYNGLNSFINGTRG